MLKCGVCHGEFAPCQNMLIIFFLAPASGEKTHPPITMEHPTTPPLAFFSASVRRITCAPPLLFSGVVENIVCEGDLPL